MRVGDCKLCASWGRGLGQSRGVLRHTTASPPEWHLNGRLVEHGSSHGQTLGKEIEQLSRHIFKVDRNGADQHMGRAQVSIAADPFFV